MIWRKGELGKRTGTKIFDRDKSGFIGSRTLSITMKNPILSMTTLNIERCYSDLKKHDSQYKCDSAQNTLKLWQLRYSRKAFVNETKRYEIRDAQHLLTKCWVSRFTVVMLGVVAPMYLHLNDDENSLMTLTPGRGTSSSQTWTNVLKSGSWSKRPCLSVFRPKSDDSCL